MVKVTPAIRCTATRTPLFPDYGATEESAALNGVNKDTHVMLSVAQGITITETDDVTAEPLLYTTEDAYSKQDFDASSSSAKEAGRYRRPVLAGRSGRAMTPPVPR